MREHTVTPVYMAIEMSQFKQRRIDVMTETDVMSASYFPLSTKCIIFISLTKRIKLPPCSKSVVLCCATSEFCHVSLLVYFQGFARQMPCIQIHPILKRPRFFAEIACAEHKTILFEGGNIWHDQIFMLEKGWPMGLIRVFKNPNMSIIGFLRMFTRPSKCCQYSGFDRLTACI